MRERLDRLRPEQLDLLRMLGGLLLFVGALTLFIRKSNAGDLGDFWLWLILLVPAVVLYRLGLGAPVRVGSHLLAEQRTARPWQSVLLVLGVILAPLMLFQFLELIGVDTGSSLNFAWIFAVTAGLALYAAFAGGAGSGALLGALALLIAWLALWDEILDGPSGTAVRWLLITAAAGFVVMAWWLERRDLRRAPDFVTAAGIAVVVAGVLGLVSLAIQFVGRAFAEVFGGGGIDGVRQHEEWDVLLLVAGIALVWYGTSRAARGPVYTGAIALFAFVISIGTEIASLFSGDDPAGSIVGWPLLLLVLGIAGLAAGFTARPQAPAPTGERPPVP